jgi:ATP-dependent DNA ligase
MPSAARARACSSLRSWVIAAAASCEHGFMVDAAVGEFAGMRLPVMSSVASMLAMPVAAIPAGRFYEPKCDGFRSIVFRGGDEVEIGGRKERPMTRCFPEVVRAVRRSFPPCAVIDGEVVVAGDGGLDFWALQQRIHPAASRVALLAAASFIAFDLLALGDDDLTGEPFEVRRAALERALANAGPAVQVTPITREGEGRARLVRSLRGRRS